MDGSHTLATWTQVAKVLTYPQRVFASNLSSLRKLVVNGPDHWPGANYVESPGTGKKSLKYSDRRHAEMNRRDESPRSIAEMATATQTHRP